MFPASFLTIAQSVNRCSLSETFFASSNATDVDAVVGGLSTLAGDGVGVAGMGPEEADLVEFCDGVFVGSGLARCLYVFRDDVCSQPKRTAHPSCLPDARVGPCQPVVVLDIGRTEMPKPVATRRELAGRIANAMGGVGDVIGSYLSPGCWPNGCEALDAKRRSLVTSNPPDRSHVSPRTLVRSLYSITPAKSSHAILMLRCHGR